MQQDIAHEKETQAGSIRLEDKEEQQRIATEKAEYERQMKQELHSQGADTERLQQISSQLRDIDRELQFIKEHATLLIEYQNRNASSARRRTTCAGKPRACRSRLMP